MRFYGADAVIATGHEVVKVRQATRVLVTAGIMTGVTEISAQRLLVNTTEDVLMAITGVDDVTVMDHQFVKLNQELSPSEIFFI
jgi:preprotein translocase subunit YajC